MNERATSTRGNDVLQCQRLALLDFYNARRARQAARATTFGQPQPQPGAPAARVETVARPECRFAHPPTRFVAGEALERPLDDDNAVGERHAVERGRLADAEPVPRSVVAFVTGTSRDQGDSQAIHEVAAPPAGNG